MRPLHLFHVVDLRLFVRDVHTSPAAAVGGWLYSIAASFRSPVAGVEAPFTDGASRVHSSDDTATRSCVRPTSSVTRGPHAADQSGSVRGFGRPEPRHPCV
jgi:hypothetical protein